MPQNWHCFASLCILHLKQDKEIFVGELTFYLKPVWEWGAPPPSGDLPINWQQAISTILTMPMPKMPMPKMPMPQCPNNHYCVLQEAMLQNSRQFLQCQQCQCYSVPTITTVVLQDKTISRTPMHTVNRNIKVGFSCFCFVFASTGALNIT